MTTRRSVLKGSTVLALGHGTCHVLMLVRNVIFARALTVEDFGIAATFALILTFVNMISDLGMERLLVQAADGDDARLGAAAQGWHLARGVLAGCLIVALAGPIAWFFDLPGAAPAFRLLGLVPMLDGLVHQDTVRLQRQLRFGAVVGSQVAAYAAAAALAWPIAKATGSYWMVLYGSILQAGVQVVASHRLSERPFRIAYDRQLAVRFLRFGWPLLLNGLVLFAVFQGDRWVIAKLYTKEDLGLYSVGVLLTFFSATLVATTLSSVSLPLLSSSKDAAIEFDRRCRLLAQIHAASAAVLAIAFLSAGQWLVLLLYGGRYAGAADFLAWLAVAQALRIYREAVVITAVSRADTKTPLVANLVRSTAVFAAIVLGYQRMDPRWIPAACAAGELLALGAGVMRIHFTVGVRPAVLLAPASVAALGVLATAWVMTSGPQGAGCKILLGLALIGATLLAMVSLHKELRRECGMLLRWLRQKTGCSAP